MAQKVVSMEAKLLAVFSSGVPVKVTALCGELEISRQTLYKYRWRFEAEGPSVSDGLCTGVATETEVTVVASGRIAMSMSQSIESGGLSVDGARRAVGADELIDQQWLEALLARIEENGLLLTGEGGFLPALVKAVLERGLASELSDHLGYEKGDPAGRASPNSRNGYPENRAERGRAGGSGGAPRSGI
jgi:hypothetical protein